jgi:hypothetical protein
MLHQYIAQHRDCDQRTRSRLHVPERRVGPP